MWLCHSAGRLLRASRSHPISATNLHLVSLSLSESYMQIRSSNMSVDAVATPRNPTIIAFDRNWRELYREELKLIDGMAYGVREDYESGYRGIKLNWATGNPANGIKVYAWSTPSV